MHLWLFQRGSGGSNVFSNSWDLPLFIAFDDHILRLLEAAALSVRPNHGQHVPSPIYPYFSSAQTT